MPCTGFPSRKRSQSVNIHFYYQLAMATHNVRRTGSAALDLAYVAYGRLDFFREFDLSPWDMAAGTLHLLADNGALHAQAIEIFGEIFRGQLRVPMPRIEG